MTVMGKVNAGLDRRTLANAIRVLAMDAVEAAKSGHPGMPMGMADIAEVLWNGYFKHNPTNPKWPDRDRFVLSNGHGSMLQYALLHLAGYDLPIEELKRFRQLHSKTPGHPEYGITPGVETTTGPLGQGLAMAVGMALTEKLLADEFNKPGHTIVDHKTFVFLGDGCLMEGISHEACSFAGVIGLEKLICFYDDNGISIDGHVDDWFRDDTPKRFESYGWRVIRDVDGHDSEAVDRAIREAMTPSGKPTMICCKTIIGWGAPNMAGTHDVHGQALGEKEALATRDKLGWPHKLFIIPQDIYDGWDAKAAGGRAEAEWKVRLDAYRSAFPKEAAEFERRVAGELPPGTPGALSAWVNGMAAKTDKVATRKASQMSIEGITGLIPEMLGGSADLTGSNLTNWKAATDLKPGVKGGNYIHFGVREFGMTAILNGVALHGGYVPFGGTFLVFSDYSRNAIRLSALMGLRNIHVFTHDSIGLGEDGPTHQPVEHAASLRIIPNLDVWRPGDLLETAVAWKAAVERRAGPTALLLTRQALPNQPAFAERAEHISRGGYILSDVASGKPDIVLIATGSEVALAMDAKALLAAEGIMARVVSMPSTNVFDRQSETWRRHVLPPGIRRVSVEAGITDFWRKYVGLDGGTVGIDRFGESAPAGDLFKHFGFTKENVAEVARKIL